MSIKCSVSKVLSVTTGDTRKLDVYWSPTLPSYNLTAGTLWNLAGHSVQFM